MKSRVLGAIAVGLISGPIAAQAATVYVGSGSMSGSGVVSLFSAGTGGGQSLLAQCQNTSLSELALVIAEPGLLPSVIIQSWTVSTISSIYISGPNPELCRTGSSVQAPFSFRNVQVSDAGVSGSNSNGSFFFDWKYSADRSTLSGPITNRTSLTTTGTVLLRAVPEPGTLAMLGIGLVGLALSRSSKRRRH
jgi:hypothetical protein